MPNGNYSIEFQVYRIDLPFFTREVLVFLFQESADESVMMGRNIHKALTQVDSELNTLALWSETI